MIFQQYYLGCLAHASYLIGDEANRTAAIVDPQRDIISTSPSPPNTASNQATSSSPISTPISSPATSNCATACGANNLPRRRGQGRVRLHSAERRRHVELRPRPPPGRSKRPATPPNPSPSSSSISPKPRRQSALRRPHRRHTLHRRRRPPRPARRPRLVRQRTRRHALRFAHKKLLALPDDSLVYPAHGAGSLCGKATRQGDRLHPRRAAPLSTTPSSP